MTYFSNGSHSFVPQCFLGKALKLLEMSLVLEGTDRAVTQAEGLSAGVVAQKALLGRQASWRKWP